MGCAHVESRAAAPRARAASSAPNKHHPAGAQTLAALARELGSRVCVEGGALAGLPAPERRWGGGGVHLLDCGTRYSHAAHATELAPKVWAALVRPWFEGVSGAPSSPRSKRACNCRSSAAPLCASMRTASPSEADDEDRFRPRGKSLWAGEVAGFNIHAGVTLRAGDRAVLERLCR
ncbi:hypothetical protein [Sorangium sp. So ce363]|uniref:hypothetical protein n=1 Tax=Sorangium sp. So ce363 TaxID=3133304 RepID=UPI003F60BAA6